MALIEAVGAREILDSRGNPTVEVEVLLEDGTVSRAAVPSGASTGAFEAYELRDGDKSRYLGKGVLKAVDAVLDVLGPAIEGFDATDQRLIDAELIELDGTDNKKKLGANAILGVLARRREGRRRLGRPAAVPLPRRTERAHAAGADDEHHQRWRARRQRRRHPGVHDPADRRRDLQRGLRWGVETYHALKAILHGKGLSTGLGDEGGFAPDLASNRAALDLLVEAIAKAGFTPGKDIALGLDVAATEFFENGVYTFEGKQIDGRRADRVLRRTRRRLPARHHRGPAGRGRLGRLGAPHRASSAPRCRSSATTSSSPTRSASRQGIELRRRQLDPRQGQPDRHAHRDARRRVASRSAAATPPSSRTAPARPRTPRSPTSPSRSTPARSRPVPRRAPSASPSTTSCCASRRSSATPRSTRAAAPSRASAPDRAASSSGR